MKFYTIFSNKFGITGQVVYKDRRTGNYWLGGGRELDMLIFTSQKQAKEELKLIKKDSTKDLSFRKSCYFARCKLVEIK